MHLPKSVSYSAVVWRWFAMFWLIAFIALPGCTGSGASPSPTATAGAAAFPTACPAMDLRAADGTSLRLTGTWLGDDNGYWQVYQQGQCVWWMGYGHALQVTMRGTVRPDLTVAVEYGFVGHDNSWGTATLKIDPTDASRLTVKVVGPSLSPIGDQLHTTVWTKVADSPIFPPPTPNP
jgi:hypothetical protein